MDCSTFSNKTAVDETTLGDEGAGVLRRQLEAALRGCEVTQQELHETRRNYQTALDVQQHLTAELEAQRSGEERRVFELRTKITALQEDILNLRTEQTTAADAHLQQTEVLETKIRNLEEKLSLTKLEDKLPEEKIVNGSSDELISLKNEHSELLYSVDELKKSLEQKDVTIATLKEHLSELEEKVTWSSDILQRKKEELESVVEALHSAQSDLAITNGELQRIKNEGNSHAEKGNSLFAEVEDKRQEMAKALIQMQQNNIQLKRELARKQGELDSLLCEKRTLWEEVAGLSGVLDAEMIKSYERRITELTRTVERQRCETARWFTKYYEPGGSQAAEWVAGVLAHLKNRCNQLTDDMLELSVDNLSKASQIRDLHKKVASLRLKAFEAHAAAQKSQPQPKHDARYIEIEVKPDIKQETKQEMLNNSHENHNRTETVKVAPKKEKTVNDVKKKVTF